MCRRPSSPVTSNALGPIAATYIGNRCAAGNRDRPPGTRRELLAVEVDSPVVEDGPQHGQMFTQSPNGVGPRGSERLTFRLVGTQPETEAEVAVSGGLRRLRQ